MNLRSAGKNRLCDLAGCARFYSRIPVPSLPWESNPHAAPDFSTIAPMLPIFGALLGGAAAAILLLALPLGLGPWVSASLAIAFLTLVTGAFHEDGLADTADALGGSAPEPRLEIMRDSRIGSFGASALILAFALRIAAVATLAERLDILALAATIIVVAATSRTAALIVFTLLPAARQSGASYALGQPTRAAVVIAAGIAALLAFVLGAITSLPLHALSLSLILALPFGVALLMTVFSAKLVGGHTGDVGGATQQLAEIAALLGFWPWLRP